MSLHPIRNLPNIQVDEVSGEFVERDGERFYAIRHVDKMPPFFISLVSDSDHWLFISSKGGLSAGRISPENALFPYIPVDKIHESDLHTGSKTLLHITHKGQSQLWEPFNREQDNHWQVERHLYKHVLGNQLCFEEINLDLQLTFRYTWMNSDQYGFVRRCELLNTANKSVRIEILDGLQNILPTSTPLPIQSNASNLVDAYKWNELDESTGLALFTLYSGITDRPQPCESLYANTVFCLGLDNHKTLLSSRQIDDFRQGINLQTEHHTRGIRGAFLVNSTMTLDANANCSWQIIAEVTQNQAQVVALQHELHNHETLTQSIEDSIQHGTDNLQRIMATVDGFQATAEENVSFHHYANVLFNSMRGGVFDDQYQIGAHDFGSTVAHFNDTLYQRHLSFFAHLPDRLSFIDLLALVTATKDTQLERLCREYLPITFGRRHGDPSRPWNHFSIRLKNCEGSPLLNYQGNWRDIFQNWEALTFSYPEFIENVIAKFVNASTIDGHNPYRIEKDGIDWEVDNPEDPWSPIGYWGDHQIIYLLKLLELSNQFHPHQLSELLRHPVFAYANVPYRIKPFDELQGDPKNTVIYDHTLAKKIAERVAHIGADGKMLPDSHGSVYQVNLLEKLLVPLLAKLGNFVPHGGIWLNTQRPEWNDANNALVGAGLSMVTLYYLRRYVRFMQILLQNEDQPFSLSSEVSTWLHATTTALQTASVELQASSLNAEQQSAILRQLGQAASKYRATVYRQDGFSGQVSQAISDIHALLQAALVLIDDSIAANRREDGLYHAYNLLSTSQNQLVISHLYPMLEGQVAALSSGALAPKQVINIVQDMFDSELYRADQNSFLLYPDRQLPSFLDKNRIPEDAVQQIPLIQSMLDKQDERIVLWDANGQLRFHPDLINQDQLNTTLHTLADDYPAQFELARLPICTLYEQVFDHQRFTGRSGGMFGFEGLGCIYWHMVSKLLLAVQENFFKAIDENVDQATCNALADLYYRVRAGLGFNKSPLEYGAFPADPYSHTPGNAGASQPGMTGQVKEEVLTRFGELGIRVKQGSVYFQPVLLRKQEFLDAPTQFRYLDIAGQWCEHTLSANTLAFTWCQTPIIYHLSDTANLTIDWANGQQQQIDQLILPQAIAQELFMRTGQIQTIRLNVAQSTLFEKS